MRFYIDSISNIQALNYALLSAPYTFNHGGWEDEHAKHKRIIAGQIAQNFLYNWLYVNNIEVKKDTSTYEENDFFDLQIKGSLFDVKSTLVNLPMQVTRTYENKKVDFFVFFKVGYKDQWWVEPIGYIEYNAVICKDNLIPYNKTLPGSSVKNRFKEGVYCYDGPFNKVNKLFKL